MKINVSEILFGLSAALDAVEGEIIGATSYHAQRVAYISTLIGRKLGLSEIDLVRLATSAVLHDNALTQFAQHEINKGVAKEDINIESNLGLHCIMGEENVNVLPMYPHIKDAILYHHEKADGTGPFGKLPDEIPLFARIIHIADRTDVRLDFSNLDEEKYEKFKQHVQDGIGINYDEGVASAFLAAVSFDKLKGIEGSRVVSVLYESLPAIEKEYSGEDLYKLSDMFARIIDFKSPFTTRHSFGIAEKVKIMGEYYGYDSDTLSRLYFAGAVHDVGKLFVDNDILEKPGKLTPEEFKKIQDHASGTYVVLHSIRGLDEITNWAALHHEKLDGTGYPFGKKAEELNKIERLMGCIDIYQALVESRPYKEGMTHEKTMSILYDMAKQGKIDPDITRDIDDRFKDWVEPIV